MRRLLPYRVYLLLAAVPGLYGPRWPPLVAFDAALQMIDFLFRPHIVSPFHLATASSDGSI